MAARSRSDAPKVRSDIYTGLLVLAFLAQMVGLTFLVLDYSSYGGKPAQLPSYVPPKPAAPVAP